MVCSTKSLFDFSDVEIGMPTLERPFGIQVWPVFGKFWTALFGYAPEDFKFKIGETYMSTLTETIVALTAYYIIIFGGRELMRNRKPFVLNGPFMVHNFYLTAISGGLLALFIEQLLPTLFKKDGGVFYAICSHQGGWTKPLVTLYYMNYLTKYLELIDTVFLVLKKKPLTFLHTYHHGATALLCYTQLIGHTAVSWVPITLNLTVHVVMYWYYFQSARGIRIWWKKYITIMQITQFIVDLGFVYFASYTYFTSVYFPWMPNAGRCAGEEFAAIAGVVILSSYLLLFLSFYAATYKRDTKAGKTRPRRNTGKDALIAMKDMPLPGADGNIAPHQNGSAMTTGRDGPKTRSRKA